MNYVIICKEITKENISVLHDYIICKSEVMVARINMVFETTFNSNTMGVTVKYIDHKTGTLTDFKPVSTFDRMVYRSVLCNHLKAIFKYGDFSFKKEAKFDLCCIGNFVVSDTSIDSNITEDYDDENGIVISNVEKFAFIGLNELYLIDERLSVEKSSFCIDNDLKIKFDKTDRGIKHNFPAIKACLRMERIAGIIIKDKVCYIYTCINNFSKTDIFEDHKKDHQIIEDDIFFEKDEWCTVLDINYNTNINCVSVRNIYKELLLLLEVHETYFKPLNMNEDGFEKVLLDSMNERILRERVNESIQDIGTTSKKLALYRDTIRHDRLK